MSRNGSGVYSLPAGNPVVTGTTISSSWANTTLSDIATALTGSVAADGQTAMTGNLQMGNNKITGLAVATASGDALSYGQAATISALTVSGAFAANGGATLGDASGDALTINSSAVSIPNGLNFDSNTFVIDATNNRVGVGTSSPSNKLSVYGADVEIGNGLNDGKLTVGSFVGTGSQTDIKSGGFTTFTTFSGGAFYERMRIDSSGNVGIGTSSPSSYGNFAVVGAGAVANLISTNATGSVYMNFYTNSGSTNLGFVGYGSGSSNAMQVWNSANEALQFATNGTERMRIDSSGNVGIGTSSPAGRLGITTSDALVVDINSTAASGGYMRYAASGTVYGYIGTSTGITGAGGTNALAVRSENSMMFATGGSSERMRIDSSGNLLVGTTSAFDGNRVSILATASGCISTKPPTNANYDAMTFRNSSGTYVGYIGVTATATTYATSSDYRLKENIAPMTGALAKVQLLKPCTYTWKATGEQAQGFIAHELAEVVPDCVTGEKDAVDAEGKPKYQGIDTSYLVATLTAAIQELNAKVDSLQAELNTLKG